MGKLYGTPTEPEPAVKQDAHVICKHCPRTPKPPLSGGQAQVMASPSLSFSLLESSSLEDNVPSAHVSLSHHSHTHSPGPDEFPNTQSPGFYQEPSSLLHLTSSRGLLLPNNLGEVKAL